MVGMETRSMSLLTVEAEETRPAESRRTCLIEVIGSLSASPAPEDEGEVLFLKAPRASPAAEDSAYGIELMLKWVE